MHEQSIMESLLALAVENAEKAGANKILKINVVVGELSGVVDEAAEFYFRFLSENTMAAGASLCFKHVPLQLRCRQCQSLFSPEPGDMECPVCKERQVEIVSGRELYLDSLEVE